METLLISFILLLGIRFICLKEGVALSRKRLALMGGFFLISFPLIVEPLFLSGALAVVLFLLHATVYRFERKCGRPSAATRTVVCLVSAFVICLLIIVGSEAGYPLANKTDFSTKLLAFVTGVLLCLKESNFVIRWFFQHYKLIEKVEALDDAPKTENGRIIGNLERLLLLVFLWEGAALAATLIVAVKGLARFKKMEEHQAFAEYVIIGTFLSVLLTMVIYKFMRMF
jgi:hypothetical protein